LVGCLPLVQPRSLGRSISADEAWKGEYGRGDVEMPYYEQAAPYP
jgi:hypothetical protein